MIDSTPLSHGLLSLPLLPAGCSHAQLVPGPGGGPTTSQVTGSVTYRERIALRRIQ